ncbi:MAG TPA: NPCBM/NEW2 domain-containing protein [Armatimonadota bacterium]|jgi:alpha-galactosidase
MQYRSLTGMVVWIMAASQASAVVVTEREMAEAGRWAGAAFYERVDKRSDAPSLYVVANNDPVQRNERNGKPMNIAGKTYSRGLYCHAASKVIVRLPFSATTFDAVIAVDSNEQTSGGRGSVVFSIAVNVVEKYRSGVLREGMPGVPVSIDLGGATEFTMEIGDAGDGISCDQADWADAKVTLENGETVWLGDLPITAGKPRTYSTDPPFSFVYGGKPFGELRKSWKVGGIGGSPPGTRRINTTFWIDPATGLEVSWEMTEYTDFPIVEWTVYLWNSGKADTPIIEGFQGLDVSLQRNADGEFVLNHNTGSPCTPTDYQPLRDTLGPGTVKRITTNGGRPTNSDLPYFNIEWPGEGVIAVIGWPGQWAAEFTRDAADGLHVVGGQELTHFRLKPGEGVRSPLIVLQFWKGDRQHAQNVWRQWMLKYNTPHPGGKLAPTHMAACSSHQYGEMINTDADKQMMFVDRYLEEKLPLDYWWMDAGWYVYDAGNASRGWPNTGTWEVDTKRFPNGLRAITDHAHKKGVKSIVWFEPERVAPGTWLYRQHPEWLLGADGGDKLLNLGNPDARKWLTDHVDGLIKSQGIDLYRQDFNIDPLPFWRANDAPDRQGLTENQHVTGYLAYWDELRRRHPDMLIDSCASGGRRNDIETLRRAVPLLRSDFLLEPTSQQNHTYGLASWIPLYGTGLNQFEPYGFRSCMCPYINACYDMRNRDADWASVRKMVGAWKDITPYYTGDYYPLTPYSVENDVWMAWQFDRPDLGEGLVQAFRRPNSVYESARLRIKGLDAERRYRVTNLDTRSAENVTGKELMETGLLLRLPKQPDSAMIVYKRQ